MCFFPMNDDLDGLLDRIRQNTERRTANANQAADEDPLHNISDNTVTKSNALSRAYYRFGLVEKRIMEALISKLHPLRTDNQLDLIELTAQEYSKAFNVPRQIAYRDMRNATQSLMRTVIRTEEHNGVSEITEFTVMSVAKYQEKEGLIRCAFNPYIVPHLVGLREKFSSYPLKQAADFRSSYTWRFYELLASWAQPKNKTGGRFAGWIDKQSVDELREMLGVPQSYSWSKFDTQVLQVAANELREKSGIVLNFERIKTVRRITHLNIRFIEENQISMDFIPKQSC